MGFLLLLVPALAFGFGAWAVAGWATARSIAWCERHGRLDHPRDYSSHSTPTPRLGGVGLFAGVLAMLVLFLPAFPKVQELVGLRPVEPTPWLAWGCFLAGAIVAFAIGLVDDLRGFSPWPKLAGQAVAAAIMVAGGLAVRQLQVPFVGIVPLPVWIGALLAFGWLVLVMNAVNFMDGINGLAGRMGMAFGVFLLGCGLNRGWCLEFTVFGAILIGASSGFLEYNYPRARTFLGDSGSQALGALLGGATLLLVTNDLNRTWIADGVAHPWFDPFAAGVIVLSPFLFDVLWTLGRRLAAGESPLRPHRDHLYQRLLRAWNDDHQRTTDAIALSVYVAVAIGFFYVRFSTPGNDAWRAFLLAAAAGNLVWYWRRATAAASS
ncbi:MAG: undecaprenyl/decaprenyl-phosphate alpha-N-acetylglucosaminyl 1-phosphate transferase [Candidatus Sumerlaeia bacterium]|nr:undecaprenyl/decaprenyl-phosphate alpha-N-acetylglucosaminyl 1-phosphate transferase [Candidatus Sumerlaeia bacterium]